MSVDVGKAIGYLDLDTSGFKRGFKSALQDLRAFNDDSASATTKMGALGSAFTSAGSSLTKNLTIPIAGAGAAVVGVAAKFESAMSEVQAISGASGDDLQRLTDKAQEMGATTKFSASESAAALKYMAMAGWDTEAMLNGINGVMQLAAASGEDLASTSDIVTDAMTAFGLSADQSTRFADVLAQTANRSNTSVALMGETFKYVAPVAGALGYSIEDASVAIGLMANSGIKGSQAGTSLKNILTNLAKPTDQVQSYMEKLNVSLVDQAGHVKPLNQLLSDMRNSFAGLTDAEKAEYAAGIAGKEGMSGLLAIVNASQSDFDKLTEAINNSSGAAQNVSDVMMNNLGGQLTILKSTLESIAISFGNILLPAIKSVTGALQNFLSWLNGLTDHQKQVIVTIATVVAAVGPVLLIIGKLITGLTSVISVINLLKPAFMALNAIMTANPIGIIIVAIAGLIAALVALYNKNEAFRSFVDTAWAQIKEVISNAVNAIVTFFTATIPGAIDAAISWFQNLANSVANFFTVVIPEKINTLAQWFATLPERIGYALGFAIGTLANWVVSLAQKAAEVGPKVIDAVVTFFSQLPGKIWNFLVQAVTSFTTWISQTQAAAATVGAQIIDTVVSFFAQLPGRIWSALVQAIDQVQQWGSDLISWANSAIPGVISSIVGFFEELPGKMLDIGKNLLLGLADGISSAVGAVLSRIRSVGDSILGGFRSAFSIHSPSRKTAEMGNMLMQGLTEGMKNSLSSVKKQTELVANAVTDTFERALPTARMITVGADVLNRSHATSAGSGSTSTSSATPVVSTQANTFVFNSPKAVVPTVAAKLLKQTAQQLSMGIV